MRRGLGRSQGPVIQQLGCKTASDGGNQRHSANRKTLFRTAAGRSPDRKAGGSIPSGRTHFEYEFWLLTTLAAWSLQQFCSNLQQFGKRPRTHRRVPWRDDASPTAGRTRLRIPAQREPEGLPAAPPQISPNSTYRARQRIRAWWRGIMPPMTKSMTLRLSEQQAAELHAVSQVEDVPVAEAVRQAIGMYIEGRRQDQAFQGRLRRSMERHRATLQLLADA